MPNQTQTTEVAKPIVQHNHHPDVGQKAETGDVAKSITEHNHEGPKGAPSDQLTETERDQIKRRAYALWCEAGRPQGQDRELWEQAELQVLKARGSHGLA